MMEITLKKAVFDDCREIYDLQIESFKALLNKYHDYDYSPGAERFERTIQRFNEPVTNYWMIDLDGKHIGAIRICNFGTLCKLKQIFILPKYHGQGYAQTAIRLVETLYPDATRWELDTIMQEDKLCYLYEKMGYRRTGKTENIKDGMDLVFYEKEK